MPVVGENCEGRSQRSGLPDFSRTVCRRSRYLDGEDRCARLDVIWSSPVAPARAVGTPWPHPPYTSHVKTDMQLLTRPRAAATVRTAPPPSIRAHRRRRVRFASLPAYRRGFAPGYTLIEMIGVVIIAAILLKMVVPNLLGGSEAARKNALINDLKGYHSQAALHYQDFQGAFPTAIQATGTPTAATMTYATSPGVGLRITGVSQQGYTVRARSTDLRKWECTMTISKTSGYNPVCTELSAEWTGSDPAA